MEKTVDNRLYVGTLFNNQGRYLYIVRVYPAAGIASGEASGRALDLPSDDHLDAAPSVRESFSLGQGFRWGVDAGAELEAGADLLAFALIFDATGDRHLATRQYHRYAKTYLHRELSDWVISHANLQRRIEELEHGFSDRTGGGSL